MNGIWKHLLILGLLFQAATSAPAKDLHEFSSVPSSGRSRLEENFSTASTSLFPCTLNQGEGTITLIPEAHSYPESKLGHELNVAEAKSGKYIYADEGRPLLRDDSTLLPDTDEVFGIEDEFLYTFSLAFVLNYGAHHGLNELEQKTDAASLVHRLDLLTLQPTFSLSWSYVERPFADPLNEELANIIDVLATSSNMNLLNEMKRRAAELIKKDFRKLNEVLSPALAKMIWLGESKGLAKFQPPSFALAKQFLENPGNLQLGIRFVDLYTVEWRNRAIAANIANLYCYSSLQKKKNLVVRMGLFHVEGISTVLRDAVNSSNGKLKIVIDPAMLGQESFAKDPTYTPKQKEYWKQLFRTFQKD